MKPPRVVAVLEVMWDGRVASKQMANPNYLAQAPRCFRINPDNHSGGRLYKLLGHSDLLVTNACPTIVGSAKGRANPDAEWLRENIEELYPFRLLLVCGNVAQETYDQLGLPGHFTMSYRTIYMPHPAARQWTTKDIRFASQIIQKGTADLHLRFSNERLRAEVLPPF